MGELIKMSTHAMTVGILSDTHGACVITQAIAEQMVQASVKAVFHCGDFGGTKILKILSAVFSPLKIPDLCGARKCGWNPRCYPRRSRAAWPIWNH